ncbi:GGDEF domain-containing protein [Mycolicibacterium sp. Y3]
MIVEWWRTPVDYDAQVDFFAKRGLTRANQVLVGASVMMVAVISTIIQFTPAGPGTLLSRVLAAGVAVGAAGWALRWWLGAWPGKVTSRVFIVCADVGMLILAIVNTDASVVGFAATVLALLSFYLMFFEGPKLLAVHAIWVVGTVVLLAVNVMVDTGGDIALAAVKVIVGVGLACVPVAIQFGIWTLQNEANESLIDPLTGLLNRRGVQLHLRNLLSRKGCGDDHIVVMVVDLDRFKDINEVHGHGVGDEVLVRSARRIQLAAAPQSVVARVGGEEFVVIAVLAATAVARAADLVCAAVYSATDAVPVTGSVGVASTTMTTSGDKPAVSARMWEALLDCADHAMFDAKRAGGNRSVHLPTEHRTSMAPTMYP